MDEPTVLDYFKALLTPWRGRVPKIPPKEGEQALAPGEGLSTVPEGSEFPEGAGSQPSAAEGAVLAGTSLASVAAASAADSSPVIETTTDTQARTWPWRAGGALVLALLAQFALEPPDRSITTGVLFYALSSAFLVLAYFRRDWIVATILQPISRFTPLTIRLPGLILSMASAVLAFLTLKGNLFTGLNVTLWTISVISLIWACWEGTPGILRWPARFSAWIRQPEWRIKITPWAVVLAGVAVLAIFFRLYRLNQVPPEMFSDHAEKLLDVGDVLNGQYSIFFPRNTGREAFQMYLTAAVSILFNTGLSFTSLKIGTTLAGLFTLPFIYLLGKEVGNRRIGLWAAAFAGIAYWPNVISRVALRFTLYPFFAAATLYFLIRGLRTGNRNQIILSGVALGIGLHGYSPFRFVPIVVVVIFLIYALHRQPTGNRKQALFVLIILAVVAFLIFLPLLRYALDEPEMFFYRTFTRIGDSEVPLEDSAIVIFLKNLWSASTMFFWSDGQTWVHSVTYRPALDVISAALFWLGFLTAIIRYIRHRSWIDITLVLIIPLLLMPSIMSLAFPGENPSLNRTGGALIPVFLLVGLALDSFMNGIEGRISSISGRRIAWILGTLLLVGSAFLNYDLVFNQYFRQFQANAWNSSEIGHVIRSFADSVGTPDSAWVVPNAHWVDTRLVGINAGYPETDYGLWPDRLPETLDVPGPKMFIVRPSDMESVDLLSQLYPSGVLSEYQSAVETKNFLIYLVPP